MKDMPMSEARDELTSLPEYLAVHPEAVTVTRHGKPVLAVLSWEAYESLVETLEILGDPALMASLRQGLREARAGHGMPWERAKRKLGL